MNLALWCGLLLTAVAGAAGWAQAAGKYVAVVEQGATASGEVQEFDRLREGSEFSLGAGETIVLGYMRSCLRETITGGKVIVGASQSEVAGGQVAREEISTCPEPRLALSAAESQESATIAFRGSKKLVFSRTPFLATRDGNLRMTISEGETVIRAFKTEGGEVDLASEKLELSPGKTYRIQSDRNTVMIEIDANAKSGGEFLTRYVYVD